MSATLKQLIEDREKSEIKTAYFFFRKIDFPTDATRIKITLTRHYPSGELEVYVSSPGLEYDLISSNPRPVNHSLKDVFYSVWGDHRDCLYALHKAGIIERRSKDHWVTMRSQMKEACRFIVPEMEAAINELLKLSIDRFKKPAHRTVFSKKTTIIPENSYFNDV